jgi:hypothetical protein
MKYKVEDKIRYRANWDMSEKYRIGVVISIEKGIIAARVRYSKQWLTLHAYVSEVSLLSPVEAVLYDWEGYQ